MGILLAIAGILILGLAALSYVVVLPVQPFRIPVPEPTADELQCAARLREHIEQIASRPHNLAHYRDLEAAAGYIERILLSFGLIPRLQEFEVEGRPVRNIEVVLPASARPTGHNALHKPPGTLVIGAHYDSPDDSPGANDNGTGVAALLEIARELAAAEPSFQPAREVRIVFFVNEEHPYGKTDDMGSLRQARALRQEGVPVMGMIALETLGYFSDEPKSQKYPPPFGLIYPTTGNFVAFVGLPGARRLVGRCTTAFRRATAFPSIGGVAPGFISGIDLSDHWAFHRCGYPALMVTDTAPFRNPHYHTRTDLPDTVNYTALARITSGLTRVIRDVAA